VFEAAYVSADITLTGTTAKNDVWTLVLNGSIVGTYTVGTGQGLAHVATGLSALSAGAGFTLSTPGDTNVLRTENGAGFTVALIPETLERTTLGTAGPGRPVNLEVDVIAKHVEKFLQR